MTASRFAARIILTVAVSFTGLSAEAQPSARVPHIGVLGVNPSSASDTLGEELRALGWVDGRNVIIDRRYTEGDVARASRLAAELIRLNVDVIVAASPPNVRAAQVAAPSLPIVMLAVQDPVGMGFVSSLARPGGNVTGVTSAIPGGLMGKELQLIKEAIPTTTRVGLLFNGANPLNYRTASANELAAAAKTLKIEVHDLEIRTANDIDGTMSAGNLRGLDAVFVVGDPLTFRHRKRIHELATLQKVPTFVVAPEYVEGLALMSYGPSLSEASRQAAVYVDKILKGAKPADLPVEQPRAYRLVVNLRTARALGLNIPSSLVMRADEVIH